MLGLSYVNKANLNGFLNLRVYDQVPIWIIWVFEYIALTINQIFPVEVLYTFLWVLFDGYGCRKILRWLKKCKIDQELDLGKEAGKIGDRAT